MINECEGKLRMISPDSLNVFLRSHFQNEDLRAETLLQPLSLCHSYVVFDIKPQTNKQQKRRFNLRR